MQHSHQIKNYGFWSACFLTLVLYSPLTTAQDHDNPFENLELRSIGPAVMGGRVSDFAFHPTRRQEFYTAHAGNMHRQLFPSRSFTVRELKLSPEATTDRQSLLTFQGQTAELYRRVSAAVGIAGEFESRLDSLDLALLNTTVEGDGFHRSLQDIRSGLVGINVLLVGDQTVRSRREAVPWSLQRRAGSLLGNWQNQSPATGTDLKAYEIASAEYKVVSDKIRQLNNRLSELDDEMNDRGAPWTSGRRMN